MTPPVGPDFGFGLYVHWPYCARICPYCDFNVYVAKTRDSAPLINAIISDIRRHAAHMPAHTMLDSVFLGGGTPSLLAPSEISQIIGAASATFGLKQDAEVTIEANPNGVLRSDMAGWKAAGINRVSIGVQSLDDAALTFLGRDHNSARALQAVKDVQTSFDNHSIDLIYARPDQSLDAWQSELQATLALGAPHLSLYELTIAERTAFGHRAARGELHPMSDDDQADLYEATDAMTRAAGLPAYEVSNHARSANYQSVHNAIYWNGGDWIGVGPGAHGRLTLEGQRLSTEATRKPSDYIAGRHGSEAIQTPLETALELLAMGLRPSTGLDTRRIHALIDRDLDDASIDDLISLGLLTQDDAHIALTLRGRLLADYVAKTLAP